MAHLQLVPVPAPAPSPTLLATSDGKGSAALACSADGLLRFVPLDAARSSTTAAYAVTLQAPSQPAKKLLQPLAAVCSLPGAGGLLFAQRGSCKLLFSQHPTTLQPGEAADIFHLGSHAAPITCIAVSPCGSHALSGNSSGGLALWSLADGAQLATAPSSEGRGSVIAACWLHNAADANDSAVVTAEEGGSAAKVWSAAAGSQLQRIGELDAGTSRRVTALAAAGELLAMGCSDGTTLLWRFSGGEFRQQALLQCSMQTDPVVALSFSREADWVAAATCGAAGLTTASVFSCASGQLIGSHALPATPVLLHSQADSSSQGSKGSRLLALLSNGNLQPIGRFEPGIAGAAPIDEAKRQKKTVRWADDARGAAVPAAGPAAEPAARSCPPQPTPAICTQAELLHPGAINGSTSAGGSKVRVMVTHPGLPPLPTHPLLRLGCQSELASMPGRSPGRQNDRQSLPAPASTATATAGSATNAQRKPLYPILDLRAFQGLQAAQHCALTAQPAPQLSASQDRPACSPARNARSHPAMAKSVATLEPVSAAAPDTIPAITARPAAAEAQAARAGAQAAALPAIGGVPTAEVETTAAACHTGAADCEEPRHQLPPALQQCSDHPQHGSPQRVSKQRCEACVTLQAAAARASRPSSPAKPTNPEQLAAPASGCSRPLKVGVACAAALQQGSEVQVADTNTFPTVEHQESPAHAEFRRQRYARLSRRRAATATTVQTAPAHLAAAPGEQQLLDLQPGHAEPPSEVQEQPQQAQHAQLQSPTQQDEQEEQEEPRQIPAAVAAAAAERQQPEAVPVVEVHTTTQHRAPGLPEPNLQLKAAVGRIADVSAQGAVVELAPCHPSGAAAAAALMQQQQHYTASAFAVDSDTELPSDDEMELQSGAELAADGGAELADAADVPWMATGSLAAADIFGMWQQQQQLRDSQVVDETDSPSSLSEAATVRPRIPVVPLLGAPRFAPMVAAWTLPQQAMHAEGGGSSRLPQPASSQRQQLGSNATLPLPLAQQHGSAATASLVREPCVMPCLPAQQEQPTQQPVIVAPTYYAVSKQAHPQAPADPSLPAPSGNLLSLRRNKPLGTQPNPSVHPAQLLAARRKAATAAANVPQDACLYTALPPVDSIATADEASAASGSGQAGSPAGGGRRSKAAALAAATKQLDERWLTEQRELRPMLEQLWTPPAERLGMEPRPDLPRFMPPRPDGRQAMACFLGLRL